MMIIMFLSKMGTVFLMYATENILSIMKNGICIPKNATFEMEVKIFQPNQTNFSRTTEQSNVPVLGKKTSAIKEQGTVYNLPKEKTSLE